MFLSEPQDKGGELHPAAGPGPGLQVNMRWAEKGANFSEGVCTQGKRWGLWGVEGCEVRG